MRHVTWAAAWFLVGLAVVLGTASVLEHRAVVAERAIQPAPQSPAPSPSGEGPLELRTLVLHPDVEESFPARACEAQGLPDDENDCDLPPLITPIRRPAESARFTAYPSRTFMTRRNSPFSSNNSVGNGPEPTRVV